MSVLPSETPADVMARMEALMDQVEASLSSADPEALFTLARRQADLVGELKKLPMDRSHAELLSRILERSRHLAQRIEEEMDAIRSQLTASANKKRIRGAYASPY
ncbi:hypothetical protein [Desulfoluna butyratoxydans]|nr:hypothetical protein [Desulfoluna butyratoxydans]